MSPQPTLVVAVDFATHAEEITLAAAEVARLMRAQVRLVHVLNTGHLVRPDTPVVPDGASAPMQALQLLEQDARAQLAPIQELLRAEGVPSSLCLRSGDIVGAIAASAADTGAVMIVIGSDIPTGLRRLVQGSVTEALIQRSSCPVLVVKATGRATGLSRARQQVRHEADG